MAHLNTVLVQVGTRSIASPLSREDGDAVERVPTQTRVRRMFTSILVAARFGCGFAALCSLRSLRLSLTSAGGRLKAKIELGCLAEAVCHQAFREKRPRVGLREGLV